MTHHIRISALHATLESDNADKEISFLSNLSLEDRLKNELAQQYVKSEHTKSNLVTGVKDSSHITGASRLLKLQQDTANYTVNMSFIAAIARKAVAVVETLVKGS